MEKNRDSSSHSCRSDFSNLSIDIVKKRGSSSIQSSGEVSINKNESYQSLKTDLESGKYDLEHSMKTQKLNNQDTDIED